MKTIEQKFYEFGVVPVVVPERAEDAVPLAEVLTEGGIPCAEITFRTDAAEEFIRRIRKSCPEMTVGAGTVLTLEQVDRAEDAGAEFVISPGFDPEITEYCRKKKIPVFPGCITPTEVALALKQGLRTLKFFPAVQAGGAEMIRALSAPYGMVKFMPTGGINEQNLREYLECDAVLCCGASWMVHQNLIRRGEFAEVRARARKAAEIVASVREKAIAGEFLEIGSQREKSVL